MMAANLYIQNIIETTFLNPKTTENVSTSEVLN